MVDIETAPVPEQLDGATVRPLAAALGAEVTGIDLRGATAQVTDGIGDLLATCMSPQSRNRYVGEQLGRGRTLDEIQAEMTQVAEGVKSAPIVVELAERHGVYVPIAEQMRACVQEGRPALEAYASLVGNPAAREIDPD